MGIDWRLAAGIAAGLVAAGALFFSYVPYTSKPYLQEPNGSAPLFVSPAMDGMRIYKSLLLRFQVSYPEELSVREYTKGNTSTIVFEDPTGQQGFQVFVVPYDEPTVSEKRFKMDVPSGVMKDPIQITIDGVSATAFWSTNSLFGETREVWFIRDGFLYEITTYKDLDPWLSRIMTTWRFL